MRIALLVPSTIVPKTLVFPITPALFENLNITRDRFGTVFEKVAQWKNTMPSFLDSLRE
jgi:hypothetical protein